jgi:hypothetical protein
MDNKKLLQFLIKVGIAILTTLATVMGVSATIHGW